MKNEKIYTSSEVAEKLCLSRQRILVLINGGRLPAQKIGRDWIVTEKDFAAFAQKSRKNGRPLGANKGGKK